MDLVGGGVDSQGGYVSKVFHVKMKESGPLGGGVFEFCFVDFPCL